jgi:hypothetical protein
MLCADSVSPFILADLEGCVRTFRENGEAIITQALGYIQNIKTEMLQMENVKIA